MTRCGECGGQLDVRSRCEDCGTRHGPAPITLTHLRGLPDGSLTKAEVNLLIDYIERLEGKLVADDAVMQARQRYHVEAHSEPEWCDDCARCIAMYEEARGRGGGRTCPTEPTAPLGSEAAPLPYLGPYGISPGLGKVGDNLGCLTRF